MSLGEKRRPTVIASVEGRHGFLTKTNPVNGPDSMWGLPNEDTMPVSERLKIPGEIFDALREVEAAEYTRETR